MRRNEEDAARPEPWTRRRPVPGGDVGYGLGLDLGTSFVAAAVASEGHVEMVTLGDRSAVAPAVVRLQEDGTLVTGDAAARRGLTSPGRLGRDLLRRLGDPSPVRLGGVPVPVTDLLAAVLRDAVRTACRSQGGPPDAVVMIRPGGWGRLRQDLWDRVAAAAGVPGAVMVTAPESVVARYAATRQPDDGSLVAVHDLGGGTFDTAVLRTGPRRQILGPPDGIDRLGGTDFDDAILSFVNYRSGGALSVLDPHDPRTATAIARLRQDCVAAKETLSVDTEATVDVQLPGGHVDVTLTCADLEDLLRAPVESTIGALTRALRAARVSGSELGTVLLVGGSSRIPLVSRMVATAVPGPALLALHPEHTAALGAAEIAARLPGPRRPPRPPAHAEAPGPRRPPAFGPSPTPPAGRPESRSPARPPTSGRPARAERLPATADDDTVATPQAPPGTDGDWQAPPIRRLLVIGTGLLALVAVIALIAYAVLSRL